MTLEYEIALYPMACYPDGSSGLFNPDDEGAPQVDAPEWFDVVFSVFEDGFKYDPVIEFEELSWGEAQSALHLLSKQYPQAGLHDLTEQCRSHWEPPTDSAAPKRLTAIFGREAVEAFEYGESLQSFANASGAVRELEFASEAERAAYIQGAQDADGWQMQAFDKN